MVLCDGGAQEVRAKNSAQLEKFRDFLYFHEVDPSLTRRALAFYEFVRASAALIAHASLGDLFTLQVLPV